MDTPTPTPRSKVPEGHLVSAPPLCQPCSAPQGQAEREGGGEEGRERGREGGSTAPSKKFESIFRLLSAPIRLQLLLQVDALGFLVILVFMHAFNFADQLAVK